MERKQILEKVVQKALDAGWQPRHYDFFDNDEKIVAFDVWKRQSKKITFFTEDGIRFAIPFYEVIFDHDFARALWPLEGLPDIYRSAIASTPTRAAQKAYTARVGRPLKGSWQYHLQYMVLAKDPIKYLAENA